MKVINMDTHDSDQNKRQKSFTFNKKLLKLTIAGGAVFWVTSIVTSLLPIAAEYRAALYYFLIGVIFNTVRFLFIGCSIGYLYKGGKMDVVDYD
ncbi:MAG: hypothetical protein WCG21_14790 [Eubacteriales bacterium]